MRIAHTALVASIVAAFSGAAGADVLDQTSTNSTNYGSVVVGALPQFSQLYIVGQTFTPGLGGQLSRIEVYLETTGVNTMPITMDIRPVDNLGRPEVTDANSVGSVSMTLNNFGGLASFDFSALNIVLSAGQQYAFVLTSAQDFNGQNRYFTYFNPSSNAGGAAYRHVNSNPFESVGGGNEDLIFNTYMVPAPATAGLLGLAGLAATRRRRA